MAGPNQYQYDREEQRLEDGLFSGSISSSEYSEQMRDLQRDYRSAADEAAWDAFEREREQW